MVAEVGDDPAEDQMYRLTFDGSVADEQGYVVMGGSAENISASLEDRYTEGLELGPAISLAVKALSVDENGESREVTPAQLEVATLDRNRAQTRKFKRLVGDFLTPMLRDQGGG